MAESSVNDADMAGRSILVVGNLNIDLIFYPVNTLPAWGEEKTAEVMLVRSAGSAGYSALALGKLGLRPTLVGNVGNDTYGAKIVKDLREVQVNTDKVRVCDGPTGVSAAMINERGDRAFVTYCGHLARFSADSALAEIDSMPRAEYALLAGYFLLPGLGPNGAIEILRACRQRGGATLFDTGCDPKGWQADTVRDVRRVLREVDVFLPNLEEAVAISGKSEVKEAARSLVDFGPETVIVKQGEQGSVLVSRTSGLTSAPAVRTQVFDTTGAGDAFNAGVIYALLKGWDAHKLLRFANATASITVSRKEARFPTVVEVLKLLGR